MPIESPRSSWWAKIRLWWSNKFAPQEKIGDQTCRVRWGEWPGDSSRVRLRKAFVPLLDRGQDIVLHPCQGEEIQPTPDEGNKWHVYLYASYRASSLATVPEEVAFHFALGSFECLRESGLLEPLQVTGWTFAEMQGRHIYLLFDPFYESLVDQASLISGLIREAKRILELSEEELSKREASRLLEISKIHRERLVKALTAPGEKQLAAAVKATRVARGRIRDFGLKVSEAERDKRIAERLNGRFAAKLVTDSKMFGEDFERIKSNPKVAELDLQAGRIIVLTNPLWIDGDSGRYPVGEYLITVYTGPSLFTVRWEHIGAGRPSPSIGEDGNLKRFGTIGDTFADLIAKGRYYEVIDLAIQAVEYPEESLLKAWLAR